jgi:putative colanic acid biosynthesis UDP-glucose lipid carrier transferase
LLIKFYGVYRFTKPIEIISKIIKQGVLFLLIVIAFFPFSDQAIFNAERIGLFIVCSLILITISKFFLFYCGYTPESIQLKELFEIRKDYGYQFLGYFSDKKRNQEIKGNLQDLKTFQ